MEGANARVENQSLNITVSTFPFVDVSRSLTLALYLLLFVAVKN